MSPQGNDSVDDPSRYREQALRSRTDAALKVPTQQIPTGVAAGLQPDPPVDGTTLPKDFLAIADRKRKARAQALSSGPFAKRGQQIPTTVAAGLRSDTPVDWTALLSEDLFSAIASHLNKTAVMGLRREN